MCSFVYENARVNEICDPSEYKVLKNFKDQVGVLKN